MGGFEIEATPLNHGVGGSEHSGRMDCRQQTRTVTEGVRHDRDVVHGRYRRPAGDRVRANPHAATGRLSAHSRRLGSVPPISSCPLTADVDPTAQLAAQGQLRKLLPRGPNSQRRFVSTNVACR